MAVELRDGSPAAVLAAIEQLLAEPDLFSPEFEKISFGDWAKVQIHVPWPEVNSSITPPFMETFLALQKQVYQLAALAKAGVADAGQLGDTDRQELQISVRWFAAIAHSRLRRQAAVRKCPLSRPLWG
jgi:hypothetical protein